MGWFSIGGTNNGSFDVPYVYSGNNLAIGPSSLGSLSSGGRNTAFGEGALPDLTTGSENTAVGSGALGDLVDGDENLAFGADALRALQVELNIAIGNDAGHETMDLIMSLLVMEQVIQKLALINFILVTLAQQI